MLETWHAAAGSLTKPLGLLAELTHRCPLGCPYCSTRSRSSRATTNSIPRPGRACSARRPRSACCRCISRAASRARGAISSRSPRQRAKPGSTPISSPRRWHHDADARTLWEAGLDHVQVSIQDGDALSADHIAGYRGRVPAQARARRRGGAARPAAHRQSRGASRQYRAHRRHGRSRAGARGEPGRDRARAVLRLGAEEPRRADADRASRSSAPSRRSRNCARRHHGRIVIDAVVPDYYARFPKPCVGGWGRRSLNVTPSGKVLPCHAAESIPELEFWNVRDHSLAEIWTIVAGLQRLPRHRLDAGAVRELRAARARFRRLPLPGVRADRRRRGDRSGVPPFAASCTRRGTRGGAGGTAYAYRRVAFRRLIAGASEISDTARKPNCLAFIAVRRPTIRRRQ